MSFGHVIYVSKASTGLSVKILTSIVFLLVAMLVLASIHFYFEGRFSSEVLAGILGIAVCIIVIPYMYAPKMYVLTHRGLVIRRILNDIFIPYSEMKNVDIISYEKQSTATDIKLWGSSGFYGFFGQFKMIKLGYVNLYLTDIKKCLLIEKVNGEKYIISPEKPDLFLRIIKGYMKLRRRERTMQTYEPAYSLIKLYMELGWSRVEEKK